MELNIRELEAVIKLETFERYKYFIKKVADSQLMYSIVQNPNSWTLAEVEGNVLLSLWSAKEYAELSLKGNWSSCSVQEMDLTFFENEILPWIKEKNILINIFSIGESTGFIVDIDEFLKDLQDELTKYE